ncbi:hypothetical protein cypCar_00038155, partial [Cyprinus carpio]
SACPSCGTLTSEDGAVHRNSCSDPDHKTVNSKGPPGRSPKTLNGLLSPHLEQPLTHSQTSLCEMLQEKEKKWHGGSMGTMDHSALIPLRSKNFRERSDAHFVDVIKEDSLMKDYFFRPPINKLSHTFIDKSLESSYRTSYQDEVKTQAPVQTFASPTFSSFLDMLLCCCVLLALSVACLLRPLVTQQPLPTPALIVAAVAAVLECLALVLAVRRAFYLDRVLNCTRTLLWAISGWVPRHMIGAVLVSLPAVAVFSHITCNMHDSIQQLSFSISTRSSDFNSSFNDVQSPAEDPTRPQDLLGPEALVAFFLLLLLVWFLNREFEADWLLRNIIPSTWRAAEGDQSYSKNHDNVGVIFASIVNFSEFLRGELRRREGVLPSLERTYRGFR